jgi:hypothetical protein
MNELIEPHQLVGMNQQQSQQGTLPPATEPHELTVTPRLERPQHPELQPVRCPGPQRADYPSQSSSAQHPSRPKL